MFHSPSGTDPRPRCLKSYTGLGICLDRRSPGQNTLCHISSPNFYRYFYIFLYRFFILVHFEGCRYKAVAIPKGARQGPRRASIRFSALVKTFEAFQATHRKPFRRSGAVSSQFFSTQRILGLGLDAFEQLFPFARLSRGRQAAMHDSKVFSSRRVSSPAALSRYFESTEHLGRRFTKVH